MRSRLSVSAFVALLVAALSAPAIGDPFGPPGTIPPSAPAGFAVTPAAATAAPTSLAFSPDGETLYVASVTGVVLAYPVIGGAALGPPTTFLSDVGTQPLGVVATNDAVFASSVSGGDGFVKRARDTDGDGVADEVATVISGLPNGRHNTNGMALGPDGMLYVTNGNSTDSGFGAEGGPPEVQPYSGSLLRVDPSATGLTPQPGMVVGTGWRNIYDVAFFPPGHPAVGPGQVLAAVPMNGPDGLTYGGVTRPAGEDTLSVLNVADTVVEHFGFPWCLYDRDNGGLVGFTQDAAEGSCNPLPAKAFTGLSSAVQAKPSALFGLHVSADGLAFNPGTDFPAGCDNDLFVAEFGNFFGDELTGHKIVRVRFGGTGAVTAVEDFLTGILPLDLTFGPGGAMWVADFAGTIYRVASIGGREGAGCSNPPDLS